MLKKLKKNVKMIMAKGMNKTMGLPDLQKPRLQIDRALLIMVVLVLTFNWITYTDGLAIFAYYNVELECDPVSAKYITNENLVST